MITIDQRLIDAPDFPRDQAWWTRFVPEWATATVRADGMVVIDPDAAVNRVSLRKWIGGIQRFAPAIMAGIPGSAPVREHLRTSRYRTWRGQCGMDWAWECLLCGEWSSGEPDAAKAAARAGVHLDRICHVTRGCGCGCEYPHLTALDAARLGLSGQEYPARLAADLLGILKGRQS